MASLRGIRIALLEARMSSELDALVRRHGGEPYCVPAVAERRRTCASEIAAFIDTLGPRSVVVFTTGVGARALVDDAEALGRGGELRARLNDAITICRGSKPIAALKTLGIHVAVRVREPWTTSEMIDSIDSVVTRDDEVTLIHYGERNAALVDAVAARAAHVRELLVYEWALPDDTAPLRRLVEEIVERRVGAVAFTSQVQVRHLLIVATEMRRRDDLLAALRTHTIVAAVGPTCADALAKVGVIARVVPEHPKMGAMVTSLARFLSARSVA
jgi:uroporphyrinogen-III synthase